ncbi:MAG: ATP-binding protein [Spirochaetia bacterium]|nr:ATP-binding protein [Spirochaetia bacterium]
MTEETRTGEIDFPMAKQQILEAVESHMKKVSGDSMVEVPNITLEKGEFRFAFSPSYFEENMILKALGVIKNHIENLRILSFETGYIVFQTLGDNLFANKISFNGIKFKFISIGGTSRIEIIRKGNLTQDEILACINLFLLFHPVDSSSSPVERLRTLGINVYMSGAENVDKPEGITHFIPENGNPWDWIAGYDKTKGEVQESIILPLRNPDIFKGVAKLARGVESGNMPRAILFEGPPGVGKTTMARVIAMETGIPLVYVPVENILSKYYGESAQNMASIFDAAAEFPNVILFLDEIDSLAGSREEGLLEATRRILSVLLRKIDGFESRDGVLTIGATNRAQDLDRALLSRFDQTIFFPLPDEFERSAIFSSYARHLNKEDLISISRAAEGLSGRNIRDVCEYAERRWARHLIQTKGEITPPTGELYLKIAGEKSFSSK